MRSIGRTGASVEFGRGPRAQADGATGRRASADQSWLWYAVAKRVLQRTVYVVPQGPPRVPNSKPDRKHSAHMGHNIFFGNLPTWVTADDIKSWLESSDLVCDAVRVIRDFETQESKGYAFVEAPNDEEMHAIIRRFNRAPIDGKLLRAKAAHPKGERDRNQGNRNAKPQRGGRRSPERQAKSRKDKEATDNKMGSLGEALRRAQQAE